MRNARSMMADSAQGSGVEPGRIEEKNFLLLVAAVSVGALCIDSSVVWWRAAWSYWLEADISYVAFMGHESYRHLSFAKEYAYHDLLGVLLTVGSVLPVLALLALSGRCLGRGFLRETDLLFRIVGFALVLFGGAYILLHMFYGGAGQHAGQTALTIHSGTTYAVMSMFVVYRLFESYALERDDRALFQNQLVILALGPWLYQVTAGVWFMVFGNGFDHSYGQQLFIAFGHFLVPLLAAYLLFSFRQTSASKKMVGALNALLIGVIVGLGHYFYSISSFQPSVL